MFCTGFEWTYHMLCTEENSCYQGDHLSRKLRNVRENLVSLLLTSNFGSTPVYCCGQWCIPKNRGGYTQRGVTNGLRVPCLFMITEVSIRCQKKTRRLVYGVYPRYTSGCGPPCVTKDLLLIHSLNISALTDILVALTTTNVWYV